MRFASCLAACVDTEQVSRVPTQLYTPILWGVEYKYKSKQMFQPEQLRQLHNLKEVHDLSWEDFEWFSKFFLEHLGYTRVCRTKKNKYGGDGGIDINCYKDNEKILGQCKQWDHGSHGFLQTKVIFEHAGYMKFYGVTHGIVMTSLEFSSMDLEYAKKLNIRLIGKREIIQEMKLLNPQFEA